MVRRRKTSRLTPGLDIEAFITDDDEAVSSQMKALPDLDAVPRIASTKPQRQAEGSGRGGEAAAETSEAAAKAAQLLGGIKQVLVPPKSETAKASEDFFDRGIGLFAKNTIFFLSGAAIFWEVRGAGGGAQKGPAV